jgi:uncharacterized protein YjeT (DUF2065 family)
MIGHDHARIALATIRLVNGTMALLAPRMMLRRLGADPDVNQVATYPLRMFGVRTVVLGVDLLAGGSVQQKGRVGVVIHATDAASAITAGLRRQLPARVALVAAGISLTNTALAAIIAQPERISEPATEPTADRATLDGSSAPTTASSSSGAVARGRYGP